MKFASIKQFCVIDHIFVVFRWRLAPSEGTVRMNRLSKVCTL